MSTYRTQSRASLFVRNVARVLSASGPLAYVVVRPAFHFGGYPVMMLIIFLPLHTGQGSKAPVVASPEKYPAPLHFGQSCHPEAVVITDGDFFCVAVDFDIA